MSDDEIIDEPGEEGELDESLLDVELGGEELGDGPLDDEALVGLDEDEDGLIATVVVAPETTDSDTPAARKASEDEEDDDDLRTSDDVEADLSAILKERLTAAEEVPLEDDEDTQLVDDKTDGLERLQPRRPDENQCTRCFLLVRRAAPGCPVEDDACPLFA
jgi:hypothetical protein